MALQRVNKEINCFPSMRRCKVRYRKNFRNKQTNKRFESPAASQTRQKKRDAPQLPDTIEREREKLRCWNSAQQNAGHRNEEISRTKNWEEGDGGKLIKARNMKKTVSTGPSLSQLEIVPFFFFDAGKREWREDWNGMEGNWKEWSVFFPRDNEKVSRRRRKKREEKEKLMKKEVEGRKEKKEAKRQEVEGVKELGAG